MAQTAKQAVKKATLHFLLRTLWQTDDLATSE